VNIKAKAIIASATILLSEPSLAVVTVTATWQFRENSIAYDGVGPTEAMAVLNARAKCLAAQSGNFRRYCENPPIKVSFSNVPAGTYLESRDRCGSDGKKLVCTSCRPIMERRELDLTKCPAEVIAACFVGSVDLVHAQQARIAAVSCSQHGATQLDGKELEGAEDDGSPIGSDFLGSYQSRADAVAAMCKANDPQKEDVEKCWELIPAGECK
jgi:hypothetical protein